MSYTIDIYRRALEVEHSLLRFATFVAFFPQLVAGPIVRAKDFLPQLQKNAKYNDQNFLLGLGQVIFGFFKKVVVADSLAVVVDLNFANPSAYTSLSLIIGVIFYGFQIYCDFSGYSDIAIGLARMMGLKFPKNFNMPYFSRSFSEFWTRWHISLSSWLRDYLYIPLGGNRTGHTYRNLMLTMFLGGLWHGANWTFVVWGILHGAYLISQRQIGPVYHKVADILRIPTWGKAIFELVLVFALTNLAWVFFRSPDFSTAFHFLDIIASFDNMALSSIKHRFHILKGSVLIGILLSIEIISLNVDIKSLIIRSVLFRTVAYVFLLLLISFAGTFMGTRFIYFQF